MRLPLEHSFGDVRALLQQEPSGPAWSLLCALLDTWPEEAEDALEEVLPYVLQHTARWPAALRAVELKAVRRAHEIARKVAAEGLDDAQLVALRGASLEAMEALGLRGRQLVASAGWAALAQVSELTTELDGEAFELVAALPGLRRLHTPSVIAPGSAHRLPALEALSVDVMQQELSRALVGLRTERLERLWVRMRVRAEGTLGWIKREAPALKRLELSWLYVEPGELRGLARPGLERLSLTHARVPHQDWTGLLAPCADTLTHLTLWATLEQTAPSQLAALELPALRHVKLTSSRLEEARLGALCGASWMGQLETLEITGQELSAAVIKRWAMPRLKALVLTDCALTPEALAALLEPGRLPALTSLTLTDLPLADRDAQALATSAVSLQLKALRLTSCRITAAQVATLGAAGFTRLDTLELTACPLEEAHVEALHRSALLRRLSVLELDAPRGAASARLRDDATLMPLVRWAARDLGGG